MYVPGSFYRRLYHRLLRRRKRKQISAGLAPYSPLLVQLPIRVSTSASHCRQRLPPKSGLFAVTLAPHCRRLRLPVYFTPPRRFYRLFSCFELLNKSQNRKRLRKLRCIFGSTWWHSAAKGESEVRMRNSSANERRISARVEAFRPDEVRPLSSTAEASWRYFNAGEQVRYHSN